MKLSQKKHKLQVQEEKTSAINRAFSHSLSWMVEHMVLEKLRFARGGDTGLGDERSMTEVSVKEEMKKLVR
ncbi:hypothetical protein Tco_1505518 [Tanacetum coccineum]